jgi:hypothetical protein
MSRFLVAQACCAVLEMAMTDPTDADEMRACLREIGWSSAGPGKRAGPHGLNPRQMRDGYRAMLLAVAELLREGGTVPACQEPGGDILRC